MSEERQQQPQQQQVDECPVCLDPLPELTYRGNERSRLLCCGKLVCRGCSNLFQNRANSLASSLRYQAEAAQAAAGGQPIATTQLESISEGFQALIQSQKCPMCRTPMPMNDREAFTLIKRNAENHGWAWACCKLGQRYEHGKGCPKNLKLAFRWIRKAAEQGDAIAQHELGNYYYNGTGVPKSLDKATKWYEKSVTTTNFGLSLYSLGRIYESQGRHREAARLFQRGADQDVDTAQCSLAFCYEHGLGVDEQSLEKSLYWNKRAADQGNTTAMLNYAGNLLNVTAIKYGSPDLPGNNCIPLVLYWSRKAVALGEEDEHDLAGQIEAGISMTCGGCSRQELPANTSKFLKCSRCKAIYYCSKECQKKNWKAGHQWDCCDKKGVKKERPR